MQRTIISMLHDAATKYQGRAYTSDKTDKGWTGCSFEKADQDSKLAAAALLKMGLKPQGTVGILGEGRSQWVNLELAIIKGRGISVPLSIKLTPFEIAFRVNHSEAVMLGATHNTLKNTAKAFELFDHHVTLIYLDDEDDFLKEQVSARAWKSGEDYVTWNELLSQGAKILEAEPSLVDDSEKLIDENDTINICYTSGTTGNPKGIMLTHLNYWTNSHDAIKLFDLPDATFETLVVLPVDHSFAHAVGIYCSLLAGITLHFADARGSNLAILRNFPKNLTEVNPVYLMTVPSITGNFMNKMKMSIGEKGHFIEGIFNRGLEAGILRNGDGFHKARGFVRFKTWFPYTLANVLVFSKLRAIFGNRMQYCVGGGALLEAKQQRFFAAIGVPVYQGYGLTEATPIISSNTPARHKFGTSGIIASSEKCRIMLDNDHEAKVGQKGEIVIQGDNVMKGYFKNPEASKEALHDGCLWTGDLGYYDEDGFLVVTGRMKALLISKDGEKYSPEEVEEVMVNNLEILNQLMVYNDHKAFTTALVTLQLEYAKKIIAEAQAKTPEEALQAILKNLRSYESKAAAIPEFWRPARFALIAKPFSEADGLVNSTMKLVRYKAVDFYKDRITKLYGTEEENSQENLSAIKQMFFEQ